MPAQERRRLIVLGCVLGVLVAAFIARAVFSGGGSSNSASNTTPAASNPFEPVIQVTQTTTTPTTSPTGSTTPTTHTSTGGSTTTTTVPSNNPGGSQTVTLIDVFHDTDGTVKARVQVGSTVYTVAEGDTFANGTYRVVSLDDPCGQFLFGDSPFKLCVGQQTLK